MTYNPDLFPKEFTLNQTQSKKQKTPKSEESIELSQQLSQSNIDNFQYQIQNQNLSIELLAESNTTSFYNTSIDFFRGSIYVEGDTLLSRQLEIDDLSLFNEGIISYKLSLFDEGLVSENYSKLSGYIECPDTTLIDSFIEISPNSSLSIHGSVTCSSSSSLSIDGKIDGNLIQAYTLRSVNEFDTKGDVRFRNIGHPQSYNKFTSDINSFFNSKVEVNGSLISNHNAYFNGFSTFKGIPVIQSDYLIFESNTSIFGDTAQKQTIYSDSNLNIFSENAAKIKSKDFSSFGLPLEYMAPHLTSDQNYIFEIEENTGLQTLTVDISGQQVTYTELEKEYEKYLNLGFYVDEDEAIFQHYHDINIRAKNITIPNESNWGFVESFKSYTINYLHAESYALPIFITRYNDSYANDEKIIGDKSEGSLSRIFTEYDFNRKVKDSLVPVGTIQIYAGFDPEKPNNNIPEGWAICDGLQLFIGFSELAEAIGTKFNRSSDPSTSVRVPDLRGLFVMGADPNSQEGEARKDGLVGGSNSAGITSANIPRHKHRMDHTHNLIGSSTHTHAMTHAHNSSSGQHTHSINHNHSVNDPQHNHGFVDQSGDHIPYVITEYNMGQPGRGGGTWDDSAPDCYGTSRDATGVSIQQFSGNSGSSNNSVTINEFSGRTGNSSSMSLDVDQYQGETEETGSETPINITPRHIALVYIIKIKSDFSGTN